MDRTFRRNTLILSGSLVAILVLYMVVFWLPQRRHKAEMRSAIQNKREAIESCKQQSTQLTVLNRELGQLQAYNEKLAEQIQATLNVREFLSTVHSLGQQEGVTISNVTPGIAIDLVGIQQQPISLTLVGRFHAIVQLMYELETMARRVAVFHRRGIRLDEAETLADSLVKRDRDLDNRRLCLECGALRPGLVCSVPTKAGAGRTVSGLVKMPQHCPGFSPVEGL